MSRKIGLKKSFFVNKLSTPISPKRVSTDVRLAAAAANAIECLTTIPVENLKLTAHHGWLHLAGTVSCSHQRATLEDVTRNLPGVRGLTDSVRVRPIPTRIAAVL